MDIETIANLKAITDMIGILMSSLNTPIPVTTVPESIIERRIPLFTEGIILLILHYIDKEKNQAPYIKSLQNNEYRVDKEGNVLLKDNEKTILFTTKELIEVLKRSKERVYESLFQYTKFKDPIRTPASLEEYLKQVKTFQIDLISTETDEEKEKVAKETERKIKNLFAIQKEVRIQDLMQSYLSLLPASYKGIIKKTNLMNLGRNYFYSRIKNLDVDFYSLSLKEQQVLLNTWFLEYNNSKEYHILATGQMLLNLEKKETITPLMENIIGLILLYGRVLSRKSTLDYDNISLSEIGIKCYDSPSVQENKERISVLQVELDALKKQTTNKEEKGRMQELLEKQKRQLDKSIREDTITSQFEIATNNNLKMKEIVYHLQHGIVTLNNEKKIRIKSTNPHTGKIIFEATIPLDSLFEIMKCIEGKLNTPKPGMN